MRIVEKIVGEDFQIGTGLVTVSMPNGGTAQGTQVSLTTFSIAGVASGRFTQAWIPSTISAGQSISTTFTVPGALLGDPVLATINEDLKGCVLSAYVSSINTVTIVLHNPTTAAVNILVGISVTVGLLVFRVK